VEWAPLPRRGVPFCYGRVKCDNLMNIEIRNFSFV